MIIDDELNNWLVNPLPQGCKLHCIIDACHSGSVMDLPYRSKIKHGQPHWKEEYAGPTSVWKVCPSVVHSDLHQYNTTVACLFVSGHLLFGLCPAFGDMHVTP